MLTHVDATNFSEQFRAIKMLYRMNVYDSNAETEGGCGKADVFIKKIGNIEILIRVALGPFCHKRFWYYFYGTIFRRENQIVPKNSLRDRKEFLCESIRYC